jgi:hypothetical protein
MSTTVSHIITGPQNHDEKEVRKDVMYQNIFIVLDCPAPFVRLLSTLNSPSILSSSKHPAEHTVSIPQATRSDLSSQDSTSDLWGQY